MTEWQTPQITEALARLEEAEVALDHAVLAAKQVEQNVPKTRLSDQDLDQVEEYARSGQAPRELRELQRKIDAGELSWEEIASGGHLDDPEVRAGLSTGVQGLAQVYALIEEGQDLSEVIESGAPQRAFEETSAEPATDDDPDDPDGPVFRTVY